MRREARAGFMVEWGTILRNILVPTYYDPVIEERLQSLKQSHDLPTVGELVESEVVSLAQGNYIGKIYYGSGRIPYIRTSDITNWEVRGSPKHGVDRDVYDRFSEKQSLQPDDILLVHEGTYLIGTLCLLTEHDLPLLIQHHLARLRVIDGALPAPLLAAMLLSPIAQRQIRSKQLSADVIDSIVGRLHEVQLPMPKDPAARSRIADAGREVFHGRAEARLKLARLWTAVDRILIDGFESLDEALTGEVVAGDAFVSFLGERKEFSAFNTPNRSLRNDVLIPKYYDPRLSARIAAFDATCDLRTVGDLVEDGSLDITTGQEIGRLNYGTGDIPFVRTSDLGNWELKSDPKMSVSEEVYEQFGWENASHHGDILLVRDGTYLVGMTAMVTAFDAPLLFSGGVYRLRCSPEGVLGPGLLMALLNSGIVRGQLQNLRFTRDVIDTLGHRLMEVVLPIPRSLDLRQRLEVAVNDLLRRRAELRAAAELLGPAVENPNLIASLDELLVGHVRPRTNA